MAQTHEGAEKACANRLGIPLEDFRKLNIENKWCRKCSTWRPRTEFDKDRSRGDGLCPVCKVHRVRIRKPTKGRVSTFKGKQHTEEAKQKMRDAIRPPSNFKGVPRSPEVRAKISLIVKKNASRGPSHYAWKGGVTPDLERLRNGVDYARWRHEVFKRDNFTCQKCGDSRGGNLRGHHLYSFANHPEFRFHGAHGITVCLPCHKKIHQEDIWCLCGVSHVRERVR